jgi:hypothetical protein
MVETRSVCNILVGNPEWKGPLIRLRYRCENNFKNDLQEVGFMGVNSIRLPQDIDRWRAVVNVTVQYLQGLEIT